MSSPNTAANLAPAQAASPADVLAEKSRQLLTVLVNMEHDPDLMSVFAIAQSRGYRVTSRFWRDASAALAVALLAYAESLKPKPEEPEAKPQG